jgi:hypothetical protein
MRLIFIDEIFKLFIYTGAGAMRGSMTECPGCRLKLPDQHLNPPDRLNTSGECFQVFSDLQSYTVAKQDPEFIHQHAVNAYEAQHAGGPTRTITVTFGLIGLYLALEKGYSGRQVQLTHMRIAKAMKDWPRLEPPDQPALLTVMDALHAGTDAEKDAMIRKWMTAVWESWGDRHAWVRETTDELLKSPKK